MCVCTHTHTRTFQHNSICKIEIATKMLPREEALVNQAQHLLSEFLINSKSNMNKPPSPSERSAAGPELQGPVTREAFHGAKGPGREPSAHSLQRAGEEGRRGFPPTRFFWF